MITILSIPLSVHGRKAIVTAILKAVDYKVEPVIPFTPPPDWATLSPTGLIPVMRDGDFVLPDSTAICHYVERKHPTPSILPSDSKQFARALWFDAYAGNLFRDVIHGLFFQKVIGPRILKRPTEQSVIDRIQSTTMPKFFGYLDCQATEAFLVGNTLTLADIAVVSNLINYQYLGFRVDPVKFPRLDRYARGVITHTAFQRALANEQPFAEQMGLDRTFIA